MESGKVHDQMSGLTGNLQLASAPRYPLLFGFLPRLGILQRLGRMHEPLDGHRAARLLVQRTEHLAGLKGGSGETRQAASKPPAAPHATLAPPKSALADFMECDVAADGRASSECARWLGTCWCFCRRCGRR